MYSAVAPLKLLGRRPFELILFKEDQNLITHQRPNDFGRRVAVKATHLKLTEVETDRLADLELDELGRF